MGTKNADTDELIERASRGERSARGQLLARHRTRLRQMVAVHMNPRLAPRVDPSDVVQEILTRADRHLSDYLRRRPLPFYLWLRRLAWERLVEVHRHHLQARKRSLYREEPGGLPLSDESAGALAERLAASGTSPSGRLMRKELRQRVQAALDQLEPRDREVLVLRYLEQLSTRETATVLGISEGAVKSRLMRALVRLRDVLEPEVKP